MGKVTTDRDRKRSLYFAKILSLAGVLVVLAGLIAQPTAVLAATGINQQINFQARLLNSQGATVPDGTYNMEFKIYQDGPGTLPLTTEVLKWTETRLNNNTQGVVVKNGYFSVMLGSVNTALNSSVDFNQDTLWLSVNVANTNATCTPLASCSPDGEMVPFKRLAANPYALNSGKLGGLTSSQYGQLATTQTFIGTNTFQPTTNISSAVVKQNSSGSFGQDVFSVQGSSSGNFIQVTSTATNAGAVTVQSLGSNNLVLDSGAALNVGPANATAINLGRTGLGVAIPATGVVAVSLTGVPAASTTSSLIQLTAAIASGSANGTYIGANPSSFTGDFENYQINGSTRFKLSSSGDVTAGFTLLDGTTTTNGTSGITPPSTSLTLTNATNFDVGNYVQVNDVNCGGTGVNPCYAKITAKAGNVLTISPGLTWTTGKTVNEYHVPELGGVDLTQALANRYGRGYFISGVATGNGTTYYNEGDVTSSLTSFDLLNTAVTTLNIGGAATTIKLGAANSTITLGGTSSTINLGVGASGSVSIPGNLSVSGTITGAGPASGTSGFFQRNTTTLSPATSGDSISTAGNIATTGSGTITSAGAISGPTATNTINGAVINAGALSSLTGVALSSGNITTPGNISTTGTGTITSAGAITAPTASNTINGAVINSGALSSITTLGLSGAITGATATNTINGLIINAGALSGISTISASGAIAAATASNTINGAVINGGALSSITTLNMSGAITAASATNTINNLVINSGSLSNVGNITGAGAVTLASGASTALNLTGAAPSTWDIGANTLSLQTAGNGAINTGTGLVTTGGALTTTGTLTVNNSALFKNTSNSTSAFQVQNLAGAPILKIDTATNNTNNLVTNPSIESAISGNWQLKGSATVTQDSTDAYYGSNSLKIITSTTGDGAKQNVSLVSATTYTVALYARSSAGNMSTFEIGRSENGSTDASCLTAQTVLKSGWTRFTCTFLTGTVSGSPYLYVKQTDALGRTSINIDAVTLQTEANFTADYQEGQISLQGAITSPVTIQQSSNSSTAFQILSSKGANILVVDTTDNNILAGNAGFEINSNGWTYNGTPGSVLRDSTQSFTGSYSLKIATTANASNGAKFTLANGSPATPSLLASTTYTLSWYARLDVSSAAFTDISAAYSPDGTVPNEAICSGQVTTTVVTGGWTRYSCQITSAVSPTAGAYLLIRQTGATAHTWYLDGVQLELGTNATAYGAGYLSLNAMVTSPLNLRNTSDSTTAFQIQSANGILNVLTVDTLNGRLGVGTASPQTSLHVVAGGSYNTYVGVDGTTATLGGSLLEQAVTDSSFSNPYRGAVNKTTVNFASDPGAKSVLGGYNEIGIPSGNSTAAASLVLRANNNVVTHFGTNTLGTAAGLVTAIKNMTTGTITDAIALQGQIQNQSTGTITNAYGLQISNLSNAGVVTNTYGLYVGDVSTGTQTNTPYSIYASDINGSNYLSGNISTDSDIALNGGDLTTTNATATLFNANATNLSIGGAATTLTIGAATGTTNVKNNLQVGSGTTDGTQTNLQLDSSSTFADAGTCSTTTNQGAMYYSTASNGVRACINGGWEDLTSTGGLGLITYGVVPDSGPGGGDIGASVGATSGPCRVSWATTTTVKIVQGCVAYSGGRKVIIPDNTTPTGTLVTGTAGFSHVCLSGTSNQPAFSTTSATETANMPTWSSNNPVVCLADVKVSTTVITNIYDVRTFTTSTKTFVTAGAAMGLGWMAIQGATTNSVATTTTAPSTTAGNVTLTTRGVVALYSGAVSTTTPNAILVTAGPQWAKATAGTLKQFVGSSATAGYTATFADGGFGFGTNFGAILGVSTRTLDAACNATTNCQYSQFLNPIAIH